MSGIYYAVTTGAGLLVEASREVWRCHVKLDSRDSDLLESLDLDSIFVQNIVFLFYLIGAIAYFSLTIHVFTSQQIAHSGVLTTVGYRLMNRSYQTYP